MGVSREERAALQWFGGCLAEWTPPCLPPVVTLLSGLRNAALNSGFWLPILKNKYTSV